MKPKSKKKPSKKNKHKWGVSLKDDADRLLGRKRKAKSDD